jgi:type III secretory pathway component EscS
MYTFLSRNGQTLGFGLGFALVVIFLIIVSSGLDSFNDLSSEAQTTSDIFNFGLYAAFTLIGIAAISALLFGLFHLLTNLKGSLKFLVALLAVVLVFVIGYNVAEADMTGPIQSTIEEFRISEGISKFISGALITSLVLSAIAAVAFILMEVWNFFK